MGLRTGLSHLRSTRRRTLLLAASIQLASPARRDKIANANQPPRPIRGQPVEAPQLAHGHAAFCYESLFVRAGRRDEQRQGAIRHAHAAIAYGRDDATALAFGGFNLGMIEHDRAAASEAFEAAIVLSPSSAFAYILGSIQLGFAGDVERAIEWGERGLRLSPLDPWSFIACHGMFLGHFQAGRFEEATNAAR